jgi:nitrite reductase (NO-forming)
MPAPFSVTPYHDTLVRVKRGDRVRFYSAVHGVQTFSVPAGGGMVFEFTADPAGEFPFVNHGFGHGQKGATRLLIVEP